jgi:hypothetical protein
MINLNRYYYLRLLSLRSLSNSSSDSESPGRVLYRAPAAGSSAWQSSTTWRPRHLEPVLSLPVETCHMSGISISYGISVHTSILVIYLAAAYDTNLFSNKTHHDVSILSSGYMESIKASKASESNTHFLKSYTVLKTAVVYHDDKYKPNMCLVTVYT